MSSGHAHVSDSEQHMMQQSTAFNELWREQVRVEVLPVNNGTNVSSSCEAHGPRCRGDKAADSYLHHIMQISDSPWNQQHTVFIGCQPETQVCRENVGHMVKYKISMRINKIMGSVLPIETAEQCGRWQSFVASVGFLEETQTTVLFFQLPGPATVGRKHVLSIRLSC